MWILVFPVAVEEGVAGWKRLLEVPDDQSVGDAMNILYQQFGPASIFIAIAASLGWWFYWYTPQWLIRRVTKYRVGSAANAEDISVPVPTTWISRSDALAILGNSSLVRLRRPSEITTVGEYLVRNLARRAGTPLRSSPAETFVDELARKLLRDFEAQHPNCVRDGQYGKEPLEWWIDEQAFRSNP